MERTKVGEGGEKEALQPAPDLLKKWASINEEDEKQRRDGEGKAASLFARSKNHAWSAFLQLGQENMQII